jgi:hypothetical protein
MSHPPFEGCGIQQLSSRVLHTGQRPERCGLRREVFRSDTRDAERHRRGSPGPLRGIQPLGSGAITLLVPRPFFSLFETGRALVAV